MDYLIYIAIIFAVYAILSLSLNLVVGYAGVISIAHAAFFGIGAYATAILSKNLGVNFFLTLVAGVTISAAISFLIGLVLSKFRDEYYVFASFGFNLIIFSIFLNWRGLTRGPLGIPGIDKPEIFGLKLSSSLEFLILALVILTGIYLASKFITQSSFGRALKAIREDEKTLQVFGYNTHRYKLTIFVISAGMAAVAGSLIASYITFIDPSSFTIMESIFILAIIILGGLANLKGSILGALILVLLPELLRFVGFPAEIAAYMRELTYGLILVVLMLYRPQGLKGEYKF